jgi:hypothetical protein
MLNHPEQLCLQLQGQLPYLDQAEDRYARRSNLFRSIENVLETITFPDDMLK